ncbi:unnamed protein product [Oncorhynchus mykiss]|uniref:Nucleoporin Nup159/Nup146 N-terminal domain-containing protein n=1 Tax=Oncorhynchus mykiss TaxID=8022 RepID=A0A060XIP7_ONCMY|nr:unnamed protein product [Oncorhynchus mykiss]
MQDFQFRQMKKTRVFDSPDDLPKDRSSLLAISNKFGLTFVGLDRKIKVYLTGDILASDKVDGNSNEIVEGIAALADVHVELPVHNLGLSSDELTLSVSGMSEASGLSLAFYDVRTFINKARLQKLPFATLQLRAGLGIIVQDLKWNPVQVSMLATCLSDGSMMVLEVTDSVTVQAQLPATAGITCVCWSPKGKQVAAGKMNATVSQYTPVRSAAPPPPYPTSSLPSAPAAFPPLRLPLATTPNPPPPVSSPASVSLFTAAPAPASSSGFSFSMPPSSTAPPAFFLGGSTAFSASAALGTSGSFSFSSKPLTETPAAASAFSVSAPKLPVVEMAPVPAPTPKPIPQRLATASPIMVLRGTPEPTTPAVKMNLNDRFLAVDTLAAAPASQPFSFNSTPKAAFSEPSSHSAPLPIVTKSAAMPGPVQTGTPSTVVQKCSPATQTSAPTPQAALSVNALERQLQQRKGSDPVMAGILEEVTD